jgi:hypothetical protein
MKRKTKFIIGTILAISVIACSPPPSQNNQSKKNNSVTSDPKDKIKAEVWADNWFAMYVNGEKVAEDSVPITTERSFNKETAYFSKTAPVQLAFIIKDFKENDTGLEYIGTDRQQMGDGGFIAQFTDTNTGKVTGFSDENWKCTVIHKAPLDKSCDKLKNPVAGQAPCTFSSQEEPSGWKTAGFDDSKWNMATVYSKQEVGPKDGYDEVNWDSRSKLIWTSDLKSDNTILCRATL